jgi:pyridoxine/pyridoxamine 5'-phosphate oxidase
MNQTDLLAFVCTHKWAIEATTSSTPAPQAAIIGIAVTDQLEIIFDTLASSRKAVNLRANPSIALVIGGWAEGDPRTVQYEGKATFPTATELERIQKTYFAAFPDGRQRLAWPGITYVCVQPAWVRLSDFNVEPPAIHEFHFNRP